MGKVRESQRRAADAWDAKNMRTIACKMRKNIADDFVQYAKERGTTPSALIKAYVLQCLGLSIEQAAEERGREGE